MCSGMTLISCAPCLAWVGLSALVSNTSGKASCFFHKPYLTVSPNSHWAGKAGTVRSSRPNDDTCQPRLQYNTDRKPLETSPTRTCNDAHTHAKGDKCVFAISPLFMSFVMVSAKHRIQRASKTSRTMKKLLMRAQHNVVREPFETVVQLDLARRPNNKRQASCLNGVCLGKPILRHCA